MLRDGKFIKEAPPKIGKFYVPKVREDERTPEERFAQNLLLGYQEKQFSLLSRVFGFILRV
jgi:CRISPR/Cas system-associated protein endoribonuclease Cas2